MIEELIIGGASLSMIDSHGGTCLARLPLAVTEVIRFMGRPLKPTNPQSHRSDLSN